MAYAIADYRTQLAALLKDDTAAVWTTDELDQAVVFALHDYSNAFPYRTHAIVTLTASSRFYNLTATPFSLIGILAVEALAYPYTSEEEPGYLLPFELQGTTLVLLTADLPDVGKKVYVTYNTLHTISGLVSATATTVPDTHMPLLCTGAAAYAAYAKAAVMAREFNWPAGAAHEVKDWGTTLLKQFRTGLADAKPSAAWASWGSPRPPAGL